MGDETRKPHELADLLDGCSYERSDNLIQRSAAELRRLADLVDSGTVAPPGAVTEVRTIVKGWKMQGGQRREFVGHHLGDCSRSESARIGVEGLPDWQPHITEVVVEERVVTPWAAALAPSPQSESEQT